MMKPKTFDWISSDQPTNLTSFQKFVRDVDWESSPLGPMATWPIQLRQMVLLIMADPSPAVIYWGEDQTIVYNEAYVPLIGQKHPSSQGQDPKIGFAEIWDHFDKVIKHGQNTGETVVEAGGSLLLQRHGFLEETYFSWKFIPIIGEEGLVVGSYATVVEVTREVVFERRMATTEAIGMHMATTTTMKDTCSRILQGLSHNPQDVPFAVVYSVYETNLETQLGSSPQSAAPPFCLLEGVLGVDEGHALAPLRMDLSQTGQGLADQFCEALNATSPVLLSTRAGSLPSKFLDDVEWRGFGVPCDKAVICPIRSSSGKVRVFLLIGLNPRRPYDLDYQKFMNLFAEQITKPHVQSVLFAEELRIGAELAEQAAIDKAELSQQLKLRTEQFEKSKLKFTRFAKRASIGLAIHNATGEVLFTNQKWIDMASLPERDTKPLWKETFAIDDRELAQQNWHQLIDGKSPVTFQARFGSSTKSKCHAHFHSRKDLGISVLCTAYPDLDEDGTVKTIMTCVTDVSALVWTENQLILRTLEMEESETKWRRFADRAPIGVCLLTKDGHLDFVNAAWTAITKSPGTEHGTGSWLDAVHPDDRLKVNTMLEELKIAQGPLTVETRLRRLWNPRNQHENNFNVKDTPATVLCSSYAEKNADGSVQMTVLWITEISVQKAAEHFLRKRMHEALEMKRQQENFIDMTSHEIRNPLSAIVQCTDDITASLRELQKENLGEKSQHSVKSALDSVDTIALCCSHQKSIVDDILTLSKLDSNLLEISPVPIQPSLIMQKLLQMFSAEMQAKSIKAELHIADSVAEFDVDWVQLDPSRLLQVLINLLTNAIKFTADEPRRSIKVSFGASLTPPRDVLGEQENFGYFSGTNEKTSALGDKLGTGGIVYLHFSVHDTGRGLTQEETSVLFKRFSQASPRTYSQYGGSGLGLFISRQLVELQGGEIGVASKAGIGSTFAFYIMTRRSTNKKHRALSSSAMRSVLRRLSSGTTTGKPTMISEKPSPTQSEASVLEENERPKPLKILLVEDNLINQTVVRKQLTKAGHIVHVANHGVEALDFLARITTQMSNGSSGIEVAGISGSVDVVLMDIEMPVMDGLTCTREIRSLQQQGKLPHHLPIIAVTANARSMQMDMAKNSGMDDIVTKPFRVPDLVGQVRELLMRLNPGPHQRNGSIDINSPISVDFLTTGTLSTVSIPDRSVMQT